MNNSLSAKLRLNTADHFKRVFGHGKKIASKRFAVFYCDNGLDYSRFGVVISRKNEKSAVLRNTFRRICKESFRALWRQFSGVDIVVVAYDGVSLLSCAELRQCLDQVLLKLAEYVAKRQS